MYILELEGVLITTRRKYSAEFKREAIFQIQHPGVSFNQVARGLVVNPNLLGHWNVSLMQVLVMPLQALRCLEMRNWPNVRQTNSIGSCALSESTSWID